MFREEVLLQYLDNELPSSDRQKLEKQLAVDPKLRTQLEQVKEKRSTVLTSLENLNLIDVKEVPSFKSPEKRFIFSSNILRFAAAAVLLIGLVISVLLLNRTNNDKDNLETVDNFNELETTIEDLDCYISPNRCWNKRKIPLITIKID